MLPSSPQPGGIGPATTARGVARNPVCPLRGATAEGRTLDTMLGDAPCPTFIKMDIEGAEVHAISGGASVIGRCRPILAVCAYHRCDHLWIIPQLLKAVLPDCRIFLRRYAELCWETVYYAIPPERLIGAREAR